MSIENSKAQILVVDDHSMSRLATVFAMSELDIEVDQAASGEEAIALFKANNYSLIFMDYNMAGMNGGECTEQIRRIEDGGGRTVIVGLTGSADKNIENKCLNAGMDAYLDKACSEQTLVETARKYLL